MEITAFLGSSGSLPYSSLRWSHPGVSCHSLYLSSWLQKWCSSFGPDPQILKVASSWGKVIFPQFRSLQTFHLPLKTTVQAWSNCMLELQGQLEGHRKAPTGPSFYHHKLENARSWKGWPLCAHMKLFKIWRAILRELRSDHQKSAQQKQPIMNIEH